MRKYLLFSFVLALALTARAETLEQHFAPLGQLIVTNLSSAPFPHPERAGGHKYHDKFFSAAEHYSDSTVVIFVPKDFREQGATDFVVHFHGWGNVATNAVGFYKLPDQLAESHRNAILVVPQGPYNASDSFGGKLEDKNGFRNFMADVVKTLKDKGVLHNTEIGNVILSGHSGGYHVIGEIVEKGGLSEKVKELWLFDAEYGQTEKYAAWFYQFPDAKIRNIYTEHGGTKQETEQFMSDLKKRGTAFFSAKEADVKPDDIKTNRLVFIFTELPHNDVVAMHKAFLQFLNGSCLTEIGAKEAAK